MLVKDKGRDIAILRTMGATQGMIMRIFFIAPFIIPAVANFLFGKKHLIILGFYGPIILTSSLFFIGLFHYDRGISHAIDFEGLILDGWPVFLFAIALCLFEMWHSSLKKVNDSITKLNTCSVLVPFILGLSSISVSTKGCHPFCVPISVIVLPVTIVLMSVWFFLLRRLKKLGIKASVI